MRPIFICFPFLGELTVSAGFALAPPRCCGDHLHRCIYASLKPEHPAQVNVIEKPARGSRITKID
jgi:hypothetical protein